MIIWNCRYVLFDVITDLVLNTLNLVQIWRTDDKDGFSPDWDSTCTKHLKGDYERVILKLMDEDTCKLFLL